MERKNIKKSFGIKITDRFQLESLKLGTKFFLYTAVLLAILTILMIIVVEFHLRRFITDQTRERGRSIARHLAATSVQQLLYYNYVALQHRAEKSLIEDDISFVIIKDKENNLAAFATKYEYHPKIEVNLGSSDSLEVRMEYIACIKKRLLTATIPVFVQNSSVKWGTIHVGLSFEGTQKAIMEMRLTLCGIGLITILLGLIWIKYLSQKVTNPVESLIDATEQLARGNLDQTINMKAKNELKILVDSFNKMIQEIRKSRQRLQQWGQDLEKKVQERTLELRQSEQNYRNLIENSLDGIFILQNDELVFANHRLEQITGYSIAEMQTLPTIFDLILLEDRDAIIEKFSNKNGNKSQKCEFRINTKNNRISWIETNASQITYSDKPALQITARDITEKRRMEARLLQAQKMESIGTLAAGIAHDFNNLLGGILGLASNLMDVMPHGNPYYEDVAYIAKVAQQGADLTGQLLAFGKGRKYKVKIVDVNHLISDIVRLLSRTIDRAIAIETHLASNLKNIKADEGQIQQAILNICINARDAMPEGGKLTLETKNVYLDSAMSEHFEDISPGYYVHVIIRDTGIGMDEETQKRVFEPFFSTKPKKQGTGLGLAMVYGTIKNHDGHINVFSEPGKYTIVKVYLPAVTSENQEKEVLNDFDDKFINKYLRPGKKQIRKGKILLVDDELVIRKVAEKILKNAGYSVLLANDGEDAVEIYQNSIGQINLVILDLVMPKQGGLETFFILRQFDSEVKVLISSGYSQNGQIQQLLNSGAKGFIKKPFFASELLKIVDQVMS